ncbi:hypothetical protein ABIB73_006889 [Bradyrhizobium sp. F1.4.3]
MRRPDPQFSKRLDSALSVPSPLLSAEALAKADAGEGKGGGSAVCLGLANMVPACIGAAP